MKDEIRQYFRDLLEDGFDVDSATDNLMDIVAEIRAEFLDGEELEEDE